MIDQLIVQERTRWSQRKRETKRSSSYKAALQKTYSSEEESSDIGEKEQEKEKEKEEDDDGKGDEGDDETSSDGYENILEASMEDLKLVNFLFIKKIIKQFINVFQTAKASWPSVCQFSLSEAYLFR